MASEGISSRDAADTLQTRVENLESENVVLLTNLSDVQTRLEKCKKIESLTEVLDIESLMKSNLAVAQTLHSFMKAVGGGGQRKTSE